MGELAGLQADPQLGAMSPEELFEAFLLGARRSAMKGWLLQAVVRGSVWNGLPFATLICLRHTMGVGIVFLLGGYVAATLVTGGICLWRQRRVMTSFAEVLDECCQAEGRIASAAEFLPSASRDAYKRLAICEAEAWLAGRQNPGKLWAWPIESYAIIPVGVLMYVVCTFT